MMNIVTKLIIYSGKGNLSFFDISVEKQRVFLNKLKEPKDLYERSFCQYRCQNFFTPYWKRMIQNSISFIITPIFTIVALIKSLSLNNHDSYCAIGHFKTMPEIIPNPLNDEYEICNDHWAEDFSLNRWDFFYIISIFKRYPWNFYFLLKCIMNIARYSYMINSFHPKALICHAEFSFTSSVLTDYCRKHNVKHIDVMHGDKLFYIRDSFFEYDECYVWDDHYKNLFIDMRAESSQFIIHKPMSLTFNPADYIVPIFYADVKYYLTSQTESELISIVSSMNQIRKNGYSIKYRPHPRFTNLRLLKKYVSDEYIEDNSQIPILESLANTSYVVGLYSTTMLQAKMAGKVVVMDDVTYTSQFYKLKDLHYIMFSNKYEARRLSEFIKSKIL